MDELVADGRHQLQAVHGLPRRLLQRRRPDPAGDAEGRARTASLIMMHAENGIAIDVLVAQALARGDTDPINHGLTRPWETEEEATHRAIMLARLTGAPLYVVHMSAKQAVATLAARARRGLQRLRRDLPAVPLPLARGAARRTGLRGREVGVLHPAAVPGRGPPGRAVALPAHRGPQRGQHRPLPVLHEGAEGARHRRLLQDPQRDRRRSSTAWTCSTRASSTGEITLERWVELCSTTPARMFGLYGAQGRHRAGRGRRHRRLRPAGPHEHRARQDAPHEHGPLRVGGRSRSTGTSTSSCPAARSSSATGSSGARKGHGQYLKRGLSQYLL